MHRITLIILSGLLLSYIPAKAFAEDKINCEDQQNAYENKMCNGMELEKLDKELNLIWKKALAKVPAAGKTDDLRKERAQFITAQKAWLQYRENHCAVMGGLQGGSNQWVTIFAQNCDIGMTQERIKFLKEVAAP